MSLYKGAVRPLLFRMDAEKAHAFAAGAFKASMHLPLAAPITHKLLAHSDQRLETEVAGVRFPNPVGVAAGFDKDCTLAPYMGILGFGFTEAGTITLRPQSGNPRPRVFRFPEEASIVNRMGFPNPGADAAARTLLKTVMRAAPVGINIGLNKDADKDRASEEYAACFAKLILHGDYFVVNVSSPNTEGLRRLQEKIRLERILTAISEVNGDKKPVFVKLSPDLEDSELTDLLPLLEKEASGVICANTTLSRPGLSEEAANTRGGLSGPTMKDLSTKMIREVYGRTDGRMPIIGVGGIRTAEDAWQKICAGASLVQVYTGLVYEGPALAGEINKGLSKLLTQNKITTIAEAVGRSHGAEARA